MSLEVLPPELKGFLERNRKGITMMFGVIIASSVVKFMRCVSKQIRTYFFALCFRQHRRSAMSMYQVYSLFRFFSPRIKVNPCTVVTTFFGGNYLDLVWDNFQVRVVKTFNTFLGGELLEISAGYF